MADFITTGSMDAARITAGILKSKDGRFLIDLTANTITMKKPGGNTVFSFDGNGNLTISGTVYASAGEFTGKITAGSGSIGGFSINGNNLVGNGVTLYGNTYGKLTLGAVDIEGYNGLSVIGDLYSEGNLTTDNRFFMTSPPSAGGSANTRLVSYSGGGGYSLGMISSSIRYKKEIHDIREYDSVSDRIDKVRAVTYTPKSGLDKGRYFYGFIAEELETEFPWLVDYHTDKETREVMAESVEYDRVPAILWADAQKTHERLKTLEAELFELKTLLSKQLNT